MLLVPATAGAAPELSVERPAAGPAGGDRGHAGVLGRLPGRPLLRQRLAHHRRDGRGLGAAAQARRRPLVRRRRPVGRAGDEVHQRARLHPLRPAAAPRGLELRRIDFVPDGRRAALYGLELGNPARRAKTVTVKVDVHSELLGAYPWGFDDVVPNAKDNLADTRGLRERRARLHRQGHAARRRAARLRDARRLRPPAARRRDRPGPLGPAAGQALRGRPTRSPPSACDDGPFGNGAGGQLRYRVTVKPRDARDGLDRASPARTRACRRRAASSPARCATPAACSPQKAASRAELAQRSQLDLPGDRQLQEAVDWGKQNIADLTQTATDLRIRFVDQGKQYPRAGHDAARGHVRRRGLPGLPVDVRHRRRVHGVRLGRRRASSRRSRSTCSRCATSPTRSTPAAARSRTRSSPTARSGSAPTPTRATPTSR